MAPSILATARIPQKTSVERQTEIMFPDPPARPLKRCARCGHLTRADRMVKGFGRDCATLLGLVGGTTDVGQRGPDLLDVLADESDDACDGWDREWRRAAGPAAARIVR